jgi:hypothetical protein
MDRGVPPHDGFPPAVVLGVDPAGGLGGFVVSVNEPFTSAVVPPPIIQLSYTSLRMGSMVVEPVSALPPAMSNFANCDSYGVSGAALAQLSGDDPYARAVHLTALGEYQSALAQVAGGDPSAALAACGVNPADTSGMWTVGGYGGGFDSAAMYATQVSTVPEPAAWLLGVLAGMATLLLIAIRNRLAHADLRSR